MTVLVIGGSGFIGAAVCRRLGEDAVAGTRSPTTSGGRLARVRVRRVGVDPSDAESLRRAMDEVRPVAVVDAAVRRDADGHAQAGASTRLAVATYTAARDAGVPHVISFCSAASYGVAPSPQHEDGPHRPTTRHGRSKLAATTALRALADGGPLLTVLRPFHVVGRGEPLDKLLPRALAAAYGGPPLPLVDGPTVRDLVDVDDCALAVERALAAPVTDGLPVNLASGRATSPQDVVDAVAAVTGRSVRTIAGHARSPFDDERRVGATDRAVSLLDWRAAPLRTVVARAVAAWPWATT